MHYQQGGGKYSIHVSRGSFASREEKLGEMHLFRGSLHSCIWELFFAWIVLVFADGVEPFCLTLKSRQFWSILSRLCRVVAVVLGDRDFPHSSDLFLAFVWLSITCFSFSFVSFLFFLFSLNWLFVCVVNALIKGEIEDWSIRGPVDGRSWL
jgi:hypothetical protein